MAANEILVRIENINKGRSASKINKDAKSADADILSRETELLKKQEEKSKLSGDERKAKAKEIEKLRAELNIEKSVQKQRKSRVKELENTAKARDRVMEAQRRDLIGMGMDPKKNAMLVKKTGDYNKTVTKEMKEQHLLSRHIQGQTTRMAMNFLSVMFIGQAMTQLFKGMLTNGMNAFNELTKGSENSNKSLTMLQANIKFIQFSLGAAISDALVPFMDEIAGFAEWVSDIFMQNPTLTMSIIFGGIAVGTIASIVGQVVLLAASIKNMWTYKKGADAVQTIVNSVNTADVSKMDKLSGLLGNVIKIGGSAIGALFTVQAGIKAVEAAKGGNLADSLGYGIAAGLSAAGVAALWFPGGQVLGITLIATGKLLTEIVDADVKIKDQAEVQKTIFDTLGFGGETIASVAMELDAKKYAGMSPDEITGDLIARHPIQLRQYAKEANERNRILLEDALIPYANYVNDLKEQRDNLDRTSADFVTLNADLATKISEAESLGFQQYGAAFTQTQQAIIEQQKAINESLTDQEFATEYNESLAVIPETINDITQDELDGLNTALDLSNELIGNQEELLINQAASAELASEKVNKLAAAQERLNRANKNKATSNDSFEDNEEDIEDKF